MKNEYIFKNITNKNQEIVSGHSITEDEFISWMEKYDHNNNDEHVLKGAFDTFDTNKDGFISKVQQTDVLDTLSMALLHLVIVTLSLIHLVIVTI